MRLSVKLLVASVAVLLIIACSMGTMGYDHPTADRQQYMKDRFVCLMYASGVAPEDAIVYWDRGYGIGSIATTRTPSCSVWASCLASRGYTAAGWDGGRLIASSYERVSCTP